MKEIKYISIQGKYAPYFYFQHLDADNFRSIVESETSGNSLVISSAYRTDILYSSNEEKSDQIIKKWCDYMGYHFDSHVKSKFIRSTNEKETFELYYDTLLHMLLHTSHFGGYKKSFDMVKRQESNHCILQELLQSDFKLSKSYMNQNMNYNDYNELPLESQGDIVHFQGFRSLALQGIKEMSSN